MIVQLPGLCCNTCISKQLLQCDQLLQHTRGQPASNDIVRYGRPKECGLISIHCCYMRVQAKNAALKEAGAIVPDSFEDFETAIKLTYNRMVKDGSLKPQPDIPAPSVPQDLASAQKAGKVHTSCWLQTPGCSCRHLL